MAKLTGNLADLEIQFRILLKNKKNAANEMIKICGERIELLDRLEYYAYIKLLRAIEAAKDCVRSLNSQRRNFEKQMKKTKDPAEKTKLMAQLNWTENRLRTMRARLSKLERHIQKSAQASMRQKQVLARGATGLKSFFVMTFRGSDKHLCKVMISRMKALRKAEEMAANTKLSFEQRLDWTIKRIDILESFEDDLYFKELRVIKDANKFIVPVIQAYQARATQQVATSGQQTSSANRIKIIEFVKDLQAKFNGLKERIKTTCKEGLKQKRVVTKSSNRLAMAT